MGKVSGRVGFVRGSVSTGFRAPTPGQQHGIHIQSWSISFWVGLGFQFGAIFPDDLPQWSRGVLDNGMAAGGIVAMVLTLLVSLKQRAQRDVLEPRVRSLPTLRAALDRSAERAGWDEVAVNRLQLAGEEAFLYLLERQEESKPQPVRVAVRPVDDALRIELVAGPDDVNLEDRLGKLDEDRQIVRDVGPRILRHVAKEVKHEQFYDLDVLTVTVERIRRNDERVEAT